MCKGSTNTTTQKTELPPALAKAYEALTGYGATLAGQPLQQYTDPIYAGFTPQETAAFDLTSSGTGAWAPFINQASDWLGQGSQSIYDEIPEYSYANLQPYMDPHQQAVIDAFLDDQAHADAVAMNEFRSQNLQSGSSPFYGDRAGVAAAELQAGRERNRNSALAQLLSSGFGNAQQQFANQQQFEASTRGADANRFLTGASGMSGLGQVLSSLRANDIVNLLRTGGLQRELNQQQLQVPYQQFQERQQYPFKIADFLRSIVSGQPAQGSVTTTTPGPNPLAQIAGLGLSILGLPSSSLGGNLLGGLFGAKFGGRFASGGVPQINPEDFQTGAAFTGQTYGLPQIQSQSPPRVTPLPPALLASLKKFPGFVASSSGGSNSGLTSFLESLIGKKFKSSFLDEILSQIGFAEGGRTFGETLLSPEEEYNQTYNNPADNNLGLVPPPLPEPPETLEPPMLPEPPETSELPMFSSSERASEAPETGRAKPRISPLLYIGLGMMASNRPDFLGAVGEGARTGLDASEAQRAAMDAGAMKFTGADGNIWVYYPSTGEKVNLGIPAEIPTSGSNTFLEYQARANTLRQQLAKLPEGSPQHAVLAEELRQLEAKIKKDSTIGSDTDNSPIRRIQLERDALTEELNRLKISNPNDPRIPSYEKNIKDLTLQIEKLNRGSIATENWITLSDGSVVPPPKADYRYKTQNGQLIGEQEPIPGSESAIELENSRAKQMGQAQARLMQGRIIIDDAEEALRQIKADPLLTTGLAGYTSGVFGPAFNVEQLLQSVKANIGFDYLQEMRRNSPTGGALGQVSDFENRLLQSVSGSLDLRQDSKQVIRALERIIAIHKALQSVAQKLANKEISYADSIMEGEKALAAIPPPGPLAETPKGVDLKDPKAIEEFIRRANQGR